MLYRLRTKIDLPHKYVAKDIPIDDRLKPKQVLVPLFSYNSYVSDVFVEVGDEVKLGQKIAEDKKFKLAIPASVSGKVTEIVDLRYFGNKIKHVVIENDFKYEKHEDFEGNISVDDLTREELVEYMKKFRVLGLGGSGFPTYIKYCDEKLKVDTVVLNGVECEPYLESDYQSMKENYASMFAGLDLLIKASGAKNGLIAIKKTHKKLIKLLEEKSSHLPHIKIKAVRDKYPAGWERELVIDVTGKSYDKIPAESGVVVNNVSTAIEFYRALKQNLPLTTRVITVAGSGVNHPVNLRVDAGTQIKDIIEYMGGYNQTGENDQFIGVFGGPMMGQPLTEDNIPVPLNVNGLLVVKYEADDEFQHSFDKEERQCISCGECVNYCPMDLMPVLIMDTVQAKKKEKLPKLNPNACVECGLCSYVCPSHIEVKEFIVRAKRLSKVAPRK
jgi:electron transport complex protein RnfC